MTSSFKPSKTATNIYPNPTRNFINIESDQIGEVTIYDLLGNLVAAYTKYSTRLTIPTNHLSSGLKKDDL